MFIKPSPAKSPTIIPIHTPSNSLKGKLFVIRFILISFFVFRIIMSPISQKSSIYILYIAIFVLIFDYYYNLYCISFPLYTKNFLISNERLYSIIKCLLFLQLGKKTKLLVKNPFFRL